MSEKIKSYKELIVWQKAMELNLLVYKLTNSFPENEKFALISQIRKSSISIPSNIAEGWGRFSNKSFGQFLKIARGSLYELETQLIIAKNLNYINELYEIENLLVEMSKMLYSLIETLDSKNYSKNKDLI